MPNRWFRLLPGSLLVTGGLAAVHSVAAAASPAVQSVTSVSVRGTVRIADESDAEGAQVTVRNEATGYTAEAEVRRGRFLVQGLEAGGPYTVTVRRIGAVVRRWDEVFLTLGEPLVLDVVLQPAAVTLDSVLAVAGAPPPLSCCHGGTASTLSDSLVHHLPSLNRNVYDFLRLVPQISTRIGFGAGGISGGGAGFRLNAFLTNGVSERSPSGSQPTEFAGGRSLPFEAVREYQVLLAPFDVRYGDFIGAVVNTVTRSGTNRWQGSAFAYGRSDALARSGELGVLPYERRQYGASFSGPIVRDRLQVLIAGELQRQDAPMLGPYVGQPQDATPPVPVAEADLARLQSALGAYGLQAGSGGAVENRNRIGSLFARVDAALPALHSRAVLWTNLSWSRNLPFSRVFVPDSFPLSTLAAEQVFGSRTAALQVHTSLRRPGGGHNELSLSRRSLPFEGRPRVRQPIVRVLVPDTVGRLTTVLTGSDAQAQGSPISSTDLILRDDLTLPLGGAHLLTVGAEAEWFRIESSSLQNAYGAWTFLSLDSLEAGTAATFEVGQDLGGARVPLTGRQFAVYAGDYWRIGKRLALTFGVRADLLSLDRQPPYNPLVDSLFGRRTDDRLERTLYLSPRIGFTWDPRGTGREQLRGGIGIFAARPPLAWFQVPLQNYGTGIGTLRCGALPGSLGAVPGFQADPSRQPDTCAGGQPASAGDVELLHPDLRIARSLRGTLAYERRLPGEVVGTLEALVTRHLSDFAVVNRNLAGPQGTDRHGRVLYGSFDSLGRATPTLVTTRLPGVFELRNVSRNYAVQLSIGLARQFDGGLSAMTSYTWSRVRDVQTPLRVNTRGFLNWALRAVSGRHDDLTPGISLNDVPHRVVLAGTWRAPWRRWTTELSLLYVGESGSPFTYRVGGGGRLGDLNADGAPNDPPYLPTDARDSTEIVLSGLAGPGEDNSPEAQRERVRGQQDGLETLIAGRPCLRRQRGRILARNSCREPWVHTTVASLRQAIPVGRRTLEAQLDVFNLLNLVNGGWGLRQQANVVLLQQVGQTTRDPGAPEPVFRYVPQAAGWTTSRAESSFQLQFGLGYRF